MEMIMEPLPESVINEQYLLATICREGAEQALAREIPRLCPEAFTHPTYRAIFEASKSLVAKKLEVSFPAIVTEMRDQGTLDKAGGVVGVNELYDTCQEVGKPEEITSYILKDYKRRLLAKLSHSISQKAEDTMVDPDETALVCQSELSRIAQNEVDDKGEDGIGMLHQAAGFESFRQGNLERGGWWGIPTLDDVAPIPVGEYSVIGARPGVGKTTAFTQAAIESARRGIRSLVISLELPMQSLKARLVSYLMKVSIKDLKHGQYKSTDVTVLGEQAGVLTNIRLQAPLAGTPWPNIEAMIRREVARHNINLVLLDQFDKIGRPEIKKGSSEAYAFGEVSTSILGLVQELNIGFILCCQLRGDAEGREPILSDHADSDRPGKDAAVVFHMWKDKDDKLKGTIQKNRDGGFVGKRLDLDLWGQCQHIMEVDHQTTPIPVDDRIKRFKPKS